MRRIAALIVLATPLAAQVTAPEKFFGFQLGADRRIARWDRIVDYFRMLEKQGSGKLKLLELGPTTMGHPFLLAIVSSAGNLSRIERLREVNTAISDPRSRTEAEIRKLVEEGRAVVCQTMSLHATEIGGTQMAPELAYDLLSRDDPDTRRILDNVIFLLVPSFNPDGAIIVADWYQQTLGTEYEGVSPPWLYHKYAGHDNNRDAFQTNLVESQYLAKILFREWLPQAYVDHHHMGSYGARLYVPPYAEPIRPHADPLTWREMSWFGAHIAYKEEEANLSGILNMAQYSGWGHFGFHWITPFHNIAGMLTESATARLATPIYIHPHQLQGGTRGLPAYESQTTFPNPWPGGWWRLRDIVERQKVSAWAVLDLAARNRETVLWNAYLKARRQTERGANGKPAAYVIPAVQHDPLTAAKLVNKLLIQGVEVQQAPKPFVAGGGMSYPANSYVVSMAQPKMGLICYLLGRTFYPDNEWTRARDGSPLRPYDMATDTMFEFMGVRVDPVDEPPGGELIKLTGAVRPAVSVARGEGGYSLDGRWNDSFRAVNLLLDKGVAVQRVQNPAGDFLVTSVDEKLLAEVAKTAGVSFSPSTRKDAGRQLTRQRIAMYQRYWGGNMDEGWTRLVLEQFGFPYTSIMDAEIKKGALNDSFDVLILPDDSTARITGETPRDGRRARETYPPEYRSGIGEDGVKALKEFAEKGGTLITFGGACNFAIDKLDLQVRDATENLGSKEFWCPGCTLNVHFDNSNTLASGMPERGLVVYTSGNPVFEVRPGEHNDRYKVVARYVDRDVLESGWLLGEPILAKKAAMLATSYGKGQVVLIGFRVQHRAQTHGTYKLLFNALLR